MFSSYWVYDSGILGQVWIHFSSFLSFHDVKFQSAFFSSEVGLNSPAKFDCFGVSLLYLRLVLQSPVGMLLLKTGFSDETGRKMLYPGICLIWLHLDYVSPH